MIPLQDPASYYEEDFHRHEFFTEESELICTIEFDDIKDERNGIWCEVTVYWHMGGETQDPAIAYERANLSNKTSGGIKTIKAELADNYGANWDQGFKVATNRTINEYRSSASDGDWLSWKDSTPEDNPYLLKPFIARTGVSLLIAPQGSNKSMFAERIGLGLARGDGVFGVKPLKKGPVLYVDFEDTQDPHQFRLTAFARSQKLDPDDLKGLIYHERVTKSLKDVRRRLRGLVRDHGFTLVIIDSIGLARASDVSGSEATIKLFKMFNALGSAVLAIDHMTKEDNKRVWTGKMDAREATPIGSQFTQSSARCGWFMNLLPDSTDEHKKFNMHHIKHNHMKKEQPFGMTLDLSSDENDQIYLADFNRTDVPFFVPKVEAGEERLTKEMEILKSHFTEGRNTEGVITTLTTTGLTKLSMVTGSTVRGVVRDSDYWEQVSGSKEYRLTPRGLEVAIARWSGDV